MAKILEILLYIAITENTISSGGWARIALEAEF